MQKLFYLGPNGTYSEEATLKIKDFLKGDFELYPVSTIAKVIDLTSKNPNCLGVVPMENSIEGIVRSSIDNIYQSEVKIQAQIDLKIKHCLVSKTSKEKITKIASHPQALAQCQRYILENFDEKIELINTNSTIDALNQALNNENVGAIISEKIAKTTHLNLLDENIGDIKENKTRFVLIAKNNINLAKKTRTSIVFNTKNKPGALLKILSIMKKYNII